MDIILALVLGGLMLFLIILWPLKLCGKKIKKLEGMLPPDVLTAEAKGLFTKWKYDYIFSVAIIRWCLKLIPCLIIPVLGYFAVPPLLIIFFVWSAIVGSRANKTAKRLGFTNGLAMRGKAEFSTKWVMPIADHLK